MGTLESVYFGVPMIGIPIFGDQPHNVEMFKKKGVAIEISLSDITEAKLTSALREITNAAYK